MASSSSTTALKRSAPDESTTTATDAAVPPAKSARACGPISVAAIPLRGAWPTLRGYTRVNVTALGPSHLGPIEVSQYGWNHAEDAGEQQHGIEMPLRATTLLNLWHGMKVWIYDVDVAASDGPPVKKYYERRVESWTRNTAIDANQENLAVSHFPNSSDDRVAYMLCGNKHLSAIEQRELFVRMYRDSVTKTPAFIDLVRRYRSGKKLLLVEPHGADDAGDKFTIHEVVRDLSVPLNYGLILKYLLNE